MLSVGIVFEVSSVYDTMSENFRECHNMYCTYINIIIIEIE